MLTRLTRNGYNNKQPDLRHTILDERGRKKEKKKTENKQIQL